ncbi:MAG TPA: hypothetical protein VG710_12675 [Opitutus sp.]|nr:hypothetical protein [Opitutus sp.]
MRTPRFFAALVVATLVLPHAWASKFALFSRAWGDAVVNTDMTQAGRALTPATPEKPVYYRGLSLGSKLGSIPGDIAPAEKKFDEFVAKILAKQGYLGVKPGDARVPALFLVVQWGYITPRSPQYMLWFLGYDPDQDIGAPSNPVMLGPEVFLRNFRSQEVETILDYAQEPAYGIIITAFDFKSASTDRPIVFWQTRVGLPAVGKSMAQALPVMAVAAGPTIGRETKSPVLGDTDNSARGHVDLGELKVVGYEDDLGPPEAPLRQKK